jgi:hypothetical protein
MVKKLFRCGEARRYGVRGCWFVVVGSSFVVRKRETLSKGWIELQSRDGYRAPGLIMSRRLR